MLGSPRRRDLFVTVLEQGRRRSQVIVVGYMVMAEHIHLLISGPQETNPSTVMHALKLGFARRALAEAKTETQSGARPSLRLRPATHLAETLLRFQRVDGT